MHVHQTAPAIKNPTPSINGAEEGHADIGVSALVPTDSSCSLSASAPGCGAKVQKPISRCRSEEGGWKRGVREGAGGGVREVVGGGSKGGAWRVGAGSSDSLHKLPSSSNPA